MRIWSNQKHFFNKDFVLIEQVLMPEVAQETGKKFIN